MGQARLLRARGLHQMVRRQGLRFSAHHGPHLARICGSRIRASLDSPYISVFCHANELAEDVTEDVLMNRETVLEFYVNESEQKDNGLVANNVRLAFSVNR